MEHKSKEEIAKECVPCRCGPEYLNRNLTAPDCPYHSTDVEEAMDEWAKQVAISFAEYMTRNDGRYLGDGKWRVGHLLTRTTEDLYTLFLTHKSNV